MSETRPERNDAEAPGQVLLFRRRHHAGRLPLHPAAKPGNAAIEPEDDLAQYEQDEQIDYRQRMLMNVIAVAVCTMLVGVGVWIADTIAEMEKDQDCVLQGRANCAPIEVPLPRRE